MAHANYSLAKYGRFRFDAGRVCLDLVATVRHRGSRPRDLLPAPAQLAQWLLDAGLIAEPLLPTEGEHRMALALREAIHDSVRAVVRQEKVHAGDAARMNELAALPVAVPRLAGNSLSWHAEMPVLSALATIARDAVTLVGTADRKRTKICRHKDCRMLFLDASPRNSRRWCAMSICGNREKVAAHRRRKRIGATGGPK